MVPTPLELTQSLADLFAKLPQVQAVALGGSRGSRTGATDSASDIDLYVYTIAEVPLAARQAIMERSGGATQADLNLNYWGPGDEWYNATTGIEIDIVYFDAAWMEEQIARVIDQHQPSMGYTTCFWYTIRQSLVFYDPHGWLAALQKKCQAEYPEPLRHNIIALNHPVLRGIIPAYAHQIEKAVKRGDLISINHRLAALLASYFDILFALNRQLHPGEKRLLELAAAHCPILPRNMQADVIATLQAAAGDIEALPGCVVRLLDHLDEVLEKKK